MKKIFKALAITAATAAMGTGIALASGCAGGNGTYTGEYHYWGEHGGNYGMMVEVTVENNIITKIVDVTNKDTSKQSGWKEEGDKVVAVASGVEWTPVSTPWETYFEVTGGLPAYSWAYGGDEFNAMTDAEKIAYILENPVSYYQWTQENVDKWNKYENWLLQQYIGWSVADVNAIQVFYNDFGEPYGVTGGYNANLDQSGLYISGATQGSGRLILAIQNALSK